MKSTVSGASEVRGAIEERRNCSIPARRKREAASVMPVHTGAWFLKVDLIVTCFEFPAFEPRFALATAEFSEL